MKERLRPLWRQAVPLIAAIALVGASAYLSQKVWRENGLRALQAVNEQRVELAVNAMKAEISRQDHLPVLLSLDAEVRGALARPLDNAKLAALSRKLNRISREADTRALYVIGPDGIVLASDDADSPETLVGRDYKDRPYFMRAVQDGKGTYLGVEIASNRARYYLAEAIRDPELLGVVVVRIEFDAVESAWERAGERVLATDSDGIVFLSSDPALKYRLLNLSGAPAQQRDDPAVAQHYPTGLAEPLDVSVNERRGPNAIVSIRTAAGDETFAHRSLVLPEYGWTIHRLADMTAIREDQRDGAIIGGTIAAFMISLFLYLLQRHRAYLAAREAGARLQSQVEERTHELREANTSLQSEIDERRRTEVRLRATQNELVQAGKLAALGQMSAAIAHEINQPLAAIRTFVASTRIYTQRGEIAQVAGNLDLINDLAERMASITAHLKTFARKSEPGRKEPVSVERAIAGALFLIDGQIRSAKVAIEKRIEPNLWVSGYPVQLEQVILNLIGNALDAMDGVAQPRISIETRASADTVYISIADNGHGISDGDLGQIFDPFFTTKPIGRGLGLGLSISYGIVQDFGGQIHAANDPQGGAVLTVELPRLMQNTTMVAAVAHA